MEKIISLLICVSLVLLTSLAKDFVTVEKKGVVNEDGQWEVSHTLFHHMGEEGVEASINKLSVNIKQMQSSSIASN